MATVEELLETQNSILEEIKDDIQDLKDDSITNTSNLSDIEVYLQSVDSSVSELKNGVVGTDENLYIQSIKSLNGGLTSESVLANNSAYYSDVASIKEMFSYQFIILGLLVGAVLVYFIVKGFFKSVSR